jgi:glycosyltransferase involved in cell wall biosynthesis
MARFRDRWAAVLATHALPGGDLAVAMGRHAPRQALFIDDTTPTPDEDAGSQAALDHMLSLIRLGHQVHFLPADNMAFCPRYTPRLEALGIVCWHRPFAQGVEDFLKAHESRFDVVYVHRRRNFAHYGRMIRALQPSARLVFSLADLHALRELREAELERQPPHRLRALRRQLDEEIALACEADAAIVHSSHESALIGAQRPEARVHVVPWSFRPVAEASVAGRAGVAFVGGFRHAPNRDAARWLVEDIWPLVEPRGVDDTLAVIGSHPGREVLALARPGVVVTGKVDDLERALASRRLTVAPLRFGAGVKGKVLTSLAHGVPCVMTTMAAEGLDLPQPLRRLVADDAASLAQLINHLLRDDAAWAEASAAGLALIGAENAPCRVDAALAAALAAPAPPPVTALPRMAGRPRRLRA